MKENEINDFKEKLISDENIIAAYIRTKNESSFNYEINNRLLYNLENYKLDKGLDSVIIQDVRNKLNNFLDNEKEAFGANLLLKVKDVKSLEFRPICVMNLEDEIAINCFLNIFLDIIKDKIFCNKRQFGNFSPLINYSDINNDKNVNDLYLQRWQHSYRNYNNYIMEELEKKDFKFLLITDLTKFYTSVKIKSFFDKISEFLDEYYIKIFNRVFCLKVENAEIYSTKELKNVNYGLTKIEGDYYFTSLPQGLIFSPIFANIFLYDINELGLNYAMYVDDIHLFCKDKNNEEKLRTYITENNLKINDKKTTILDNEAILNDYKRLIRDYGSNASILRSYSKGSGIDIEEEKFILNNTNDIKEFLKNKKDEHFIYEKYLNKINAMIEYRNSRYYTYKSDNILNYSETVQLFSKFIDRLEENEVDLKDLDTIECKIGSLNAKLYNINEYLEKIFSIYIKCKNTYLNNVLFRFLNRNYLNRNEFKKQSSLKKDILFKEKFYQISENIANINEFDKVTSDNYTNIIYFNEDIYNSKLRKNFFISLFKKIFNEQIYNMDYRNIFYKYEATTKTFDFKFVDNYKEISTIINTNVVFPERLLIYKLTEIIKILLMNVKSYTVWEYRIFMASGSYYEKVKEYLNQLIKFLDNSIDNDFEYLENDIINMIEKMFVPSLWKENVKYIDLILSLYLITKKLFGQGMKHLYFYTLHNQEHTKTLLINLKKFIIGQIFRLRLTQKEILYMYIAIILHDLGMVYIIDNKVLRYKGNMVEKNINKLFSIFPVNSKINLEKYQNILIRKVTSKKSMRGFRKIKNKNRYLKVTNEFLEKYSRNLHAVLSMVIIDEKSLNIKLLLEDAGINLEIIYALILAHADLNSKIDFKNCKSDMDLEKMAEIIKLIDFTDITNKRINIEFYNTFKNSFPKNSRENYEKHLKVLEFNINNNEYDETKKIFFEVSTTDTNSIKELDQQIKRYNENSFDKILVEKRFI